MYPAGLCLDLNFIFDPILFTQINQGSELS